MAETLTLRLRRITWEAPGVVSLDLVDPAGAALPPFTPGAHIDLHLPDGLLRQYSLCGDPADTTAWRIAVREVPGGRASRAIHQALRPGALLTVGLPRNNFPLDAAPRYLFLAGGIGITPLLPMMRAATAAGVEWTLLFCTPTVEAAPFLADARALGGTVHLHATAAGTRLDVATMLAHAPAGTLLYCCGPQSLMTAVEAATTAWPANTVRFEWFAPREQNTDAAAGGFELVCARSGVTLPVAAHVSVLETLRNAGIDVQCSCEQGVCGTCETRVLEGEVDHRDSILSAAERAANTTMMTCVSRARSPRLVLDL